MSATIKTAVEIHIKTLTGNRVISKEIKNTNRVIQYVGKISQAGTNAPTFSTPALDELDGAITPSYNDVGDFSLTFDAADNPSQEAVAQITTPLGTVWTIPQVSGVINIGTYSDFGVTAANDILTDAPIVIYLPQPEVDFEGYEAIFDEVLLELDANQLLLWTKIVIRDIINDVIIEVDGNTYRKTEDFSASSTEIYS